MHAEAGLPKPYELNPKPYRGGRDGGEARPLREDVDVEKVDGVVEDPGPGFRRRPVQRLPGGLSAQEDVSSIDCSGNRERFGPSTLYTLITLSPISPVCLNPP